MLRKGSNLLQGRSPLMLTGKRIMDLGKLVWTVSFLLVLFSSPMLVFDLIGIQRSVEVASGADIWYDGQVAVDLLRLQAAVRDIEPDPSPEVLRGGPASSGQCLQPDQFAARTRQFRMAYPGHWP